jgi:lysophospholipase L1-like esterase
LAATWHINSAARQAAYLQYLRALQAAGTQVVLLQLPRSAAAEAAFPVRLKQQWQRALEQISAAEKFQLWQPPRPPEDEYCDQGHLTQDGRARFSRWLAQQLAAELQAVR